MIVTCASCLTKFSMDESKVPAGGAKVRCSRCKHVFRVMPPLEKREEEETVEGFEFFAKSHEEVIDPRLKSAGPPPAKPKERGPAPPAREGRILLEEDRLPGHKESIPIPREKEEEEPSFYAEEGPSKPARMTEQRERWEAEEKAEGKARGFQTGKKGRRERRGPSLVFFIFVILILLIFGAFYLWTELETGGKLAKYVDAPVKKIARLWETLWKTEKQGLVIRDLNGYEEKAGETPLFVIEGKVTNQSQFTKKYIKVKVVILDPDKREIASKEAVCGPVIRRADFKSLPPAFFEGEIVIKPQSEKEMMVPRERSIPFMVIFKDLSSQANEWKVQISEAPNL